MPRSFTFFALAATAIVLAGCVPRHYYENLYAVARGMTKTEVQAALGPANTVRTKDHLSAWQYCDEIFDLGIREIRATLREGRPIPALTLWFDQERLVDITVYHNNPSVTCSDFLQTFKWSDFPFDQGAWRTSFK